MRNPLLVVLSMALASSFFVALQAWFVKNKLAPEHAQTIQVWIYVLMAIAVVSVGVINGKAILPNKVQTGWVIATTAALFIGSLLYYSAIVITRSNSLPLTPVMIAVATIPVWSAIIEATLNGQMPSGRTIIGTVLVFAAMAVLSGE